MTNPNHPDIYNDRPRICPTCSEVFPGFTAYWNHAENDHGWTWRDGVIRPPEDGQIGAGRSALYVLGIWPTTVIHRETARTLASINASNATSARHNFRRSIRHAEDQGLLRRDGDWIRILDRPGLYAKAIDQIVNPTHEKFLAINAAIPVLAALIRIERNAAYKAQRERELDFVRSLMNPYSRGVPMKGKRRRIVAAGRPS